MNKDLQQLASMIHGVRQDLQQLGDKLLTHMEKIMASLDDVVTKVKAEGDVVDSAITLLQSLSQKLTDAGTDPQKLADLAASIDSQSGKLAAAVASNTPAAATAAPTSPDATTPVTPAPTDSTPPASQ